MFFQMIRFEVRYFIRQPSFYITAAVFLILPFLMMSVNRINLAGNNAHKNGAYSVAMMTAFFGAFALFLVINFVANTAIRNASTKMEELIYCKPLQPAAYQLGRFLGAYFVVLAVFCMVPFGFFLGALMTWINPDLFGENKVSSYLLPYTYLAIPTLFALSCCAYALALKFRSMMAVNLFAIGLFIAYDLSESLFVAPGYRFIAALMDPFGVRTITEMGRYWSMFEKNTSLIVLDGVLLQNRLLWLGIGVVVIGLFGNLNRVPALARVKRQKGKSGPDEKAIERLPLESVISYKGQVRVGWQQLLARTRFEIQQVIFTPSFLILLIMATTLMIVMLTIPEGMFGTAIWPLTQSMVRVIQSALNIVVMIIIAFYSAEVVWREREAGMGDVIDSLPVHNLHFWLSKLFAVWAVVILLVCYGMVLTIGFQLASGFADIDLRQYLVSLFYFSVLPWCLLTVLAFLLQVLSSNKYMGMSLFVLFILSSFAMEPLGLGHNMFRFARAPQLIYSDMNGFGWFLTTQFWYMLYWTGLTVAMAITGYGLWQRGPQQRLRQRISMLRYQIGIWGRRALLGSLSIFVLSGGNIYYNTMVLNNYTSPSARYDDQANYEKSYASYADNPLPSITQIKATVDIYPETRSIVAVAEILLVNRSTKVIEKFLVGMPEHSRVSRVSITSKAGSQVMDTLDPVTRSAGPLRSYWFVFTEPMAPGESRKGTIEVRRENHGFVDSDADVNVVRNGTFINNAELFPVFGYQPGNLLADRNERRKRGLPPPMRAHKLEDSRYYNQSIFGEGVGFIDFETTISTTKDQIAIAPGYLQEQWVEDSRAYFHYKMDAPIANYYAFLSAEFEVAKEEYKGVKIEVFHHASHGINMQRMVESIKASLDYYSESYGPYQHRQARIIEFPGYRSFAQSFANTIPFSERIGFFSDLRDTGAVDPVYFVTAHEMAHQWWGGQVDGANVQGNTLLSESLAHYSALRVSENKYGKLHSRKILSFELDRYLRERTEELVAEMPWMKVENQAYIHYRKGVVVMNSIREVIGEARLNAVLKDYVEEFKFKETPYPTTLDLKARLDEGATESEKAFLKSIFEQITLYDIKVLSVDSIEVGTDEFEVTLVIEAERFIADGYGEETKLAMDEFIEVGLSVLDPEQLVSSSDIYHLDRFRIKSGLNTLNFTVAENPKYAVLDPFVKLVDREPADNYLEF